MTESSPPSSPPRRGLRALGVLVVVAAVLLWVLGTSDVERFDVTPAVRVVGPSGTGAVLVQTGDGAWSVVDPRRDDARTEIPTPLLDEPVLALGGAVFALHPDGMSITRADKGVVTRVDGLPLPATARLLGVMMVPSRAGGFRDLPLVGWSASEGEALHAMWIDLLAAAGGDTADVLRPIATRDGLTARVPPDADVLTSRFGPSFAFLGDEGWEAWTLVGDEGEPRTRELDGGGLGDARIGVSLPGAWDPTAVRVAAPDHRVPLAHFTPDASALIVEGRRGGGLYTLDLLDRTLQFMAEGNLGSSERVSPGGGFRGEPPRLVTSQWSREDFLQIFETHLSGGGRIAFKVSLVHNHLVALNPSGERMAYAVARFEEAGDEPFEETLYVFDFGEPSRGALELGSRRGGLPDRGPLFVDDRTVVWVEDGVLRGLRHLPESTPPTDP